MNVLNKFFSADCVLVDGDAYAVYCKSFSMVHVMDFKLQFRFRGSTINVTLSESTLVRNCTVGDTEITDTKQRFGCLLNLQLSHDQKIILGEPFLK